MGRGDGRLIEQVGWRRSTESERIIRPTLADRYLSSRMTEPLLDECDRRRAQQAEEPAEPEGQEPSASRKGTAASRVDQLERRLATLE